MTDVASRLPKEISTISTTIEPCGHQDVPCVNISRKADFTQSTCNKAGRKKDLVVFIDSYTLNVNNKIYQVRAQTRGNTEIVAFDLSHSEDQALTPSDKVCVGGNNLCDYRWNITVDDKTRTAKAKYVIKNGYSGNREGIGFWSNFKIRDIVTEIKLPKYVTIKNKEFKPVDITNKKCLPESNRCHSLFTTDQVSLLWDWNMWAKCN